MEHPLRSPLNAVFYIRLIPSGFTRERPAKAAAAASQLSWPSCSFFLSVDRNFKFTVCRVKILPIPTTKPLCVVTVVPLYDQRKAAVPPCAEIREGRTYEGRRNGQRFLNDNAGGLIVFEYTATCRSCTFGYLQVDRRLRYALICRRCF